MKKRSKLISLSGAGGSVRAMVFLCLIAHAFLVCFTHHHSNVGRDGANSTPGLTAGTNGESSSPMKSGGDANCLSCRLERNFVSDIQPASLIVDLLKAHVNPDASLSEPHSHGTFLVPSDRAPPLA